MRRIARVTHSLPISPPPLSSHFLLPIPPNPTLLPPLCPSSISSPMAIISSQVAAAQSGSASPSATVAVASARRSSARIKKINEQMQTSVETARKKREANPSSKKPKNQKKKAKPESPQKKQPEEQPEEVPVLPEVVPRTNMNPHAMVTDTIRTFNKFYLHFVQAEQKRCAQDRAQAANVNLNSKGDVKRTSKRPDLKAISEMKRLNVTLYPEKRIGPIPGIDVGHQFFSRAEMVVVGFHQHWLNGIDYIGKSGNKAGPEIDLKGYKLPITTSIVLSGQYEDNLDNLDRIVYTGQGGNDLLGNKRQIKDQVLERGNLGLQNCKDQSVPVRVIRGHDCQSSYVGKVYTYDGLYEVIDCWTANGQSGHTVYKFLLERLRGQPPLTTDQVHFTRGRIPNLTSEIRGLVCRDISGGLEDIPIPVTNLVDDPPVGPSGFTYLKDLKYGKNIHVPINAPEGCNCVEDCSNSKNCACAIFNGGDLPYVRHKGGRLVEPKTVIFECGPNCKCGPNCVNKTSQNGPKYRLEVFRTPNKGWGVRSWDCIPSGAPVCEYIGLVKRTNELDPAADNTYVFDIDCLQTMKGLDGRESRYREVPLPSHLEDAGQNITEDVPFCIDGELNGNVSRFINHSCQPNLFVQCVLSNHHDMKLARIVLVAADNIAPLKELSYDYGYAIDSVVGPDGQMRRMNCYCGAQDCRKRLY
ncbi:histone-lysine N-methyltransferase, H3 lysine-9 specific SUVH4 [Andrographis paniculata]|uniref:histone-lysine N-methyltransferase, H3 lysine-9 specific SUVH4 n=1 Tax=Andrographis paniculata TaxID=175694 RepID=UPI0021E81CFC|nr:histone-lysine N-methyltransferase, H3 lysine-9 specific SUVH4 [Andrographis paniculata]